MSCLRLTFSLFAACALFTSCGSEDSRPVESFDVSLSLPGAACDNVCGNESVYSGGDLAREFDRIAVGTVNRIEVEETQNLPFEQCIRSSVSWTLLVHMSISENLQGTGETASFRLGNSATTCWNSRPMRRIEEQWVPTGGPRTPEVRVSPDLGWTAETGVHVGQQLMVLLYDTPNGQTPYGAPLAEIVDNSVQFQFGQVPLACVRFDERLTSGLTVSEFAEELLSDETAPDVSLFPERTEADESFCQRRLR